MKKHYFVGILLICISLLKANGQAVISGDGGIIYVNKNMANPSTLEGKRGGYFGTHQLGDTIQLAYDKFLKYYVEYKSEGGAYATEKKTVFKDEIYKSVLQFDKFFKKEVRSGRISKKEAQERFKSILNSAIGIRFYETTQFESLLSTTRDLELKEHYFNNVRVISN